jgi:hypothetical protein
VHGSSRLLQKVGPERTWAVKDRSRYPPTAFLPPQSSQKRPPFPSIQRKMTTTARTGSPTDEELLHIDDRRVYGYDPLAQPALIKYGAYQPLVVITGSLYRPFLSRYSALQRVSLDDFPSTPCRGLNHPEPRRPRAGNCRSLLDSFTRRGYRVRQAPQKPSPQVGRFTNRHANLFVGGTSAIADCSMS